MINSLSQSGNATYGVNHFVLDTIDDLLELKNKSENSAPGSTAFIIENSQKYMLNGKKQWIKISTSSSPENPPIDPDKIYIWDGGVVL